MIRLLTNAETTVIDIVTEFFQAVIEFFIRFGEIGLFFYSIFETITPMAGVEFLLVPLILSSPERWWLLTLNLVTANTIGAIFVYFFLAKEDNRFYKRMVSKKQRERAKKLFDRYGFWAIFIFAMTPLPFFLIVFTAAIAKMNFKPFVFSAVFSRAVRFGITSYFVYRLREQADTGMVVFWLGLIGVSFAFIMMGLQRIALKYFEGKAESSPEDEWQDSNPERTEGPPQG